MAKHMLETKDNIIEKYLLVETKSKDFFLADKVVFFKNQLIQFYGDIFLKGDFTAA